MLGAMPNAKDVSQIIVAIIATDFLPIRLCEYGNRIQINLSILINITKNTEASLAEIDNDPAIRHVIPDRQVSDCIEKCLPI